MNHAVKYNKPRMQNNYKNKDSYLVEMNSIQNDNQWILDSGASHHTCKYRHWFTSYKEIDSENVYSANDCSTNELKAIGKGNINIETRVNNIIFYITLHNVYHVPNLRKNLLSVSEIEKKNKRVIFDNGTAKIFNKITRKIVGEAHIKNGLYILNTNDIDTQLEHTETHMINKNNLNESEIWHQRLCHTNIENVKELSNKELVRRLEGIKINEICCIGCKVGKSTKPPCRRITSKQSQTVLELIHTDLCGPMPVESIGGSKYFLTFTDDFTRKTIVYCLNKKSKVKDYLRKYIAVVERQLEKKIKKIRSDNGLEFCNDEIKKLFNEVGIKHERTNTYTPQMNGVAERINRTLLDMVRVMLKTANLPEKFWAEALMTASYIKNRTLHSAINGNVPKSLWTGNKPSIKHLKVYGCLAIVHVTKHGKHKLDSRGKECVMVGYSNQTKGYRLWDPITDDVIQSKHVKFVEEIPGYSYIYQSKTYDIHQ